MCIPVTQQHKYFALTAHTLGIFFLFASWLPVALLCPIIQLYFSPETVAFSSGETVTSKVYGLLRAQIPLGSLGTHCAI